MKTLLCITLPNDIHFQEVAKHIDKKINVIFIDSFDFPELVSVHIDYNDPRKTFIEHAKKGKFYIRELLSVWWRKPNPVNVKSIEYNMRSFLSRECNDTLYGFLYACESAGVPVVNNPLNNFYASVKPYQLAIAKKHNLIIPHTIITNTPDEARSFIDTVPGATLVKGVSMSWAIDKEDHYSIFVRKVSEEQYKNINSIRECPATLQKNIEKDYDVRVIYVAGKLISFKIDFPLEIIDWRLEIDKENSIKYTELKLGGEDFINNLKGFMDELGLRFGVFDFVVGKNGLFYFLEVNPNGQWLWLDRKSDSPVSKSLAHILTIDNKLQKNVI